MGAFSLIVVINLLNRFRSMSALSNHEKVLMSLHDRLSMMDEADKQIATMVKETSNVVQILNQNNDSTFQNSTASNQEQCQASMQKFSEAIKKFQNILSTELSYLQKNSSSYPHQGSVYINTMKLDLAVEASKTKCDMLKNLNTSNFDKL